MPPGYTKQTGFVTVGPQPGDLVEHFRKRMESHGLLGNATTIGVGNQPEMYEEREETL